MNPKQELPDSAAMAAENSRRTAAFIARRAEGRRNSQADQDNLDSAHAALVEAGATCGTNPTAASRGAALEHQQKLDAAHDALVASGANCDNASADAQSARAAQGSNAERDRILFNPPNPYVKAAGLSNVLRPSTDKNYAPRSGAGADGYAIALALRTALASTPEVTPAPMVLDERGVPNPYSPEALRKHQAARR